MMTFTFSFDDGYQSWMRAADVLEARGCRGTFNVCLRNVTAKRHPARPRMFPPADVLTWDEVEELQERGHEIASHGTRHIDLGRATPQELRMEVVQSKAVFDSRGIKVKTYACAFNGFNDEVDRMTLTCYQTVRGSVAPNNPLPFTGRVYHAMGWVNAVNGLTDDLWSVGIWHDVSPGFDVQVDRILGIPGVVAKTVREVVAQ